VEELQKRTTGGGNKTLVVRLSQEEYGELRRAVGEANVPNMSLLVFEAIQAGLESDETHGIQRKRTRTVNIHISREFREKIRLRARMFQVTQQTLLRGLLFQYIRNKPWQRSQAEKMEGA
jgi:hypothetical protein